MQPKHPDVAVIVLCSRLHPQRAREALRLRAVSVLKYPVPAGELRATILQALDHREVRPFATAGPTETGASSSPAPKPLVGPSAAANGPTLALVTGSGSHNVGKPDTNPTTSVAVKTRAAPAPDSGSPQLVEQPAREIGLMGNDPSWRQILDLAGTIATTRASVLIVGEPGTGKSLLARLIHALGSNPDRPFITVEASALADELATHQTAEPSVASAPDSALVWSKKLNPARGGTLYLAEVTALPIELQQHLLRELQFRDYEATSGLSTPQGEVRFLMSTSENLPDLVEHGRFSQELFHRISVISLMLPPLRHRGTADIELLAESFRARYAQEFHKSVTGFARDALDILQRHDWPRNVRELDGVIRRAVALCSGSRITSSHLAHILDHHRPTRGGGSTPRSKHPMGIRPLKEALEEPEKRFILETLQASNWNRQETARVLDINRTTLYKKMKKYGLIDGADVDELN
jgi:two-component system response regulator HydG